MALPLALPLPVLWAVVVLVLLLLLFFLFGWQCRRPYSSGVRARSPGLTVSAVVFTIIRVFTYS